MGPISRGCLRHTHRHIGSTQEEKARWYGEVSTQTIKCNIHVTQRPWTLTLSALLRRHIGTRHFRQQEALVSSRSSPPSRTLLLLSSRFMRRKSIHLKSRMRLYHTLGTVKSRTNLSNAIRNASMLPRMPSISSATCADLNDHVSYGLMLSASTRPAKTTKRDRLS